MTLANDVFAFQSCDNNELKCINSNIPFENIMVNIEEIYIKVYTVGKLISSAFQW